MTTSKKLYDLTEIRELIPLSRSGLYLACKQGNIPTVKIGRRIFVPAWYVNQLVNEPDETMPKAI